jgi:hypothetical protein
MLAKVMTRVDYARCSDCHQVFRLPCPQANVRDQSWSVQVGVGRRLVNVGAVLCGGWVVMFASPSTYRCSRVAVVESGGGE